MRLITTTLPTSSQKKKKTIKIWLVGCVEIKHINDMASFELR